jgi:hypothetical protein
MSAIAKPAIKSACKLCTEILSQELTEKSRSQHRPQQIATAAAKNAIAFAAIGEVLATHPRREEAMHPATK